MIYTGCLKMTRADNNILPERLDPQVMLAGKSELVGCVPVKGMARLKNAVVSMDPTAMVDLRFIPGLYGFPKITGRIKHVLWLRCERCLGKMEISMELPLEVCIKPKSESLPATASAPEFYEYDGRSFVLADLIEDELLLALPLAPKHKDISLCDQSMVAWLADKTPTEKRDSPFSILKR